VAPLEGAGLVEGSRKRAARGSKELTFQMILGYGRAVVDLVGGRSAGGSLAERFGDDLLANAGFPLDQHGSKSAPTERLDFGAQSADRRGRSGQTEGPGYVGRLVIHALVRHPQYHRHVRSLAIARGASQLTRRILAGGMMTRS